MAAANLPWLAASFQFDDFNVIVDNARVHSLGAWWADIGHLRPLLKLSYTLNWLLSPTAAAFRAVNLLIHGGCVVLGYHLLRQLPTPGGVDGRLAAQLAMAAFALHPLHTEAVTYICGRSTSLMSLLLLCSCLCYLRSRRRAIWLLPAALSWLAAITVKEVALILPLFLLLLECSLPTTGKPARRLWPWLLAMPLLAVALLWQQAYARLFDYALHIRPWRSQLAMQGQALLYLLQKLVWPSGLSIDPQLPASGRALAALVLGGWAVGLVYACCRYRQRPWLLFCLAWPVIAWLPTNSLLPRLDSVNERQAYLADIGCLWGMALLALRIAAHWPRAWQHTAVALLLLALGIGTGLRNADYTSEISLWTATVRTTPGKARPWNNLGFAYEQADNTLAALAAYQHALELDPAYTLAADNRQRLLVSVFPQGAIRSGRH